MSLLFDAHLDLSLNAIDYNRDLRQGLDAIRDAERGMSDLWGRATGVVCLPEMRRGGIQLCVATLIAGCMEPRAVGAGWRSPEQAWAQTQAQLAWYRAMEADGQMEMMIDRASLERAVARAESDDPNAAIGYVLSLEGADSIRTPAHLEAAYATGLRALGPAHYGVGRYALGHDQQGPLAPKGRELLNEMARLGIILDATHLCDETFFQAMDLFEGSIWASHSNCRALVEDPRQFSDTQILRLIERGSVIGCALDAWMMIPGWVRHQSTPDETGVCLNHLVDHIDHICQLAGNARHVGIGSDLDGGFGYEQTPIDVRSIADVAQVEALLSDRGFSREEVMAVLSGNFIRFLREAWS